MTMIQLADLCEQLPTTKDVLRWKDVNSGAVSYGVMEDGSYYYQIELRKGLAEFVRRFQWLPKETDHVLPKIQEMVRYAKKFAKGKGRP